MDQRHLLDIDGDRNFTIAVHGSHKRKPNGILGLLCKQHYPGSMVIAGQTEAATSWEHYIAAADEPDREGRFFGNKAGRVVNEFWDFYRFREQERARAFAVAHFACKKLVQDMMYEARVQAIISFWALRGVTVKKGEARNMRLTRDQFISV
ncbi:unnamed protein product, partial [Urochloa humidicola]